MMISRQYCAAVLCINCSQNKGSHVVVWILKFGLRLATSYELAAYCRALASCTAELSILHNSPHLAITLLSRLSWSSNEIYISMSGRQVSKVEKIIREKCESIIYL